MSYALLLERGIAGLAMVELYSIHVSTAACVAVECALAEEMGTWTPGGSTY